MANLESMDVGRYHIEEQLGEGGMATVYKAFDSRLEREVAIKFIRREVFTPLEVDFMLKRFEREAKALARLSHPNIVHVHDYGEHEGLPYLVMEYIPGGTLKSLTGKPMPAAAAAKLLAPVARALEYAHELNVIHRDVKPANILLTARGQPMLSDFGIAKILEQGEPTLTGSGVGVGTPEYMSPEQGLGQGVDHRTDIYALGVVFYELVSGRKPFIADTPMAVVVKHLTEPLPPLRDFVPDIPPEAEKLVSRALAKEPANRYPGMGGMASALERMAASALSPEPGPEEEGWVILEEPPPLEAVAAATPAPQVAAASAVATQPRLAGSAPYFSKAGGAKSKKRLLLAGLGLLAAGAAAAGWFFGQGGGRQPAGSPQPAAVVPAFTATTYAATAAPAAASAVPGSPPAGTLTPPAAPTSTLTATPTLSSTPAVSPTPGAGATQVWEKDSMVLVFVPAGEFKMGSSETDKLAENDEKPQHTVTLADFWIDRIEVSVGQYVNCVKAGGCREPSSSKSATRSSYFANSLYASYPVIYVDWNQAKAYCEWAGRRLPTEAEWDKAARGTDGRIYPWGSASPTCMMANYNQCGGDTRAPAGMSQGASPYGALNITGNVWEWVADWYGNYSSAAQHNPQGPASGTYKTVRGGSWINEAKYVRAANRNWYSATKSDNIIGFRCAR